MSDTKRLRETIKSELVETHDLALDEVCPACNAIPGMPCRGLSRKREIAGKGMATHHPERERKAVRRINRQRKKKAHPMKKQPQQPEQQRSDYSASGDRGWDRAIIECATLLKERADQLRRFRENGVSCAISHEYLAIASELEYAAGAIRSLATPLSVGHDASSEPRQNETNAVAVREALAELGKLEAVTKAWNTYDADSIQVAVAARNALPAIAAARALLEETK